MGTWWAPRASNPLWSVKSIPGEFDSHTFPPIEFSGKSACPEFPVMQKQIHKNHGSFYLFVNRLRFRGAVIGALTGFFRFISTEILLMTAAGAAVVWWGSSALGSTLRILLLAVAAVLFYLLVVQQIRNRLETSPTLRVLSSLSDMSLSDLKSAFEFSLTSPSTVGTLANAHIELALEKTHHVPASDLWPARSMFTAMALMIWSAAVCWLLVTTNPVILISAQRIITGAHIPTASGTDTGLQRPVVSDVALTLHFPEYLKRKEVIVHGWSGGLEIPAGTRIDVRARPLEQGLVYLKLPGREHALGIDGDTARAGFVFNTAGRCRFEIRRAGGELVRAGPWRMLKREDDRPPVVRLFSPVEDMEINSGDEVDFEFEVFDDVGLSSVELVYAPVGMKEKRRLVHSFDSIRSYRGRWSWDTAETGLMDESVTQIQVRLEAKDTNSYDGPSTGASPVRILHILTPGMRHRKSIESMRTGRDVLVDLLAAELTRKGTSAGKRSPGSDNAGSGGFDEALSMLGESVRLVSRDPLASRRTAVELSAIRQKLLRLDVEFNKSRKSTSPRRRRLRVFLEASALRLDDLLGIEERSLLTWKGRLIEKDGSRLEKLLQDFIESGSEISRQKLLDHLDQTELKLRSLLRGLDGIGRDVLFEHVNFEAVFSRDPLEIISRARHLLAAGMAEDAATELMRLSRSVGRMLTGMESYLSTLDGAYANDGERMVNDIIDRAADLESYQRQVVRQTTAVMRRYQERLVKKLRGEIDRTVSRQLRRLRRLKTDWRTREIKKPWNRDDVARAERFEKLLEEALKQGDLDEAVNLATEMGTLMKRMAARQRKKAGPVEAARKLEQIVEELRKSFPRPRELLSSKDRNRMKALARRQRDIIHHTRKLRKKATNREPSVPFLSAQAARFLDAAASFMETAVKKLDRQDVSVALSAQNAALSQLGRLREEILSLDSAAPVGSGGLSVHETVRISDPEEFEVPREFRSDIIQAMKSGVPEEYRDEIAEYYSTLVH